jgi:hypothetical protein
MPITISRSVVADQHAGVHSGRGEIVEVSGNVVSLNGSHGGARTQIVAQELDLARQGGRDREAAMADDLGGHTWRTLLSALD